MDDLVPEEGRDDDAIPAAVSGVAERIVDEAFDAIFSWDFSTERLTFWNQAAARFYGFTRSDAVLASSPHALLHTEFPKGGLPAVRERLLAERRWDGELRHHTRDGQVVTVESRMRLVVVEGRVLVFEANRDISERRFVEEMLRTSSQFFQQVIASAQEGILVYDRNLRCVVMNPYMEAIAGWPATHFLGSHITESAPKELAESVLPFLQRALEGESVSRPEVWLSFPAGDRWISDHFAPMRGIDGSVIGVIVTVRDISARKRAEAEQVEASRFYQQIVDSAEEGIFAIDGAQRFTVINPCLERLTGIVAGEALGRPILEVIAARGVSPLVYRDALPQAFAGELVQIPDGLSLRGDRRLSRRLSPLRDGLGRITGVIGIVTDVTERHEAALALQEANDRLAAALGAAGIGVWEIDLDRQEVTWARNIEVLLGRESEPFDPAIWTRYVHPDDVERLEGAVQRAMQGRSGYDTDVRVLTPDRGTRWARLMGRVLRATDGQPSRLVSVAVDITERQTLESQLQQSQKMEAIGQLAGGVAHDFNNLLTAILGYSRFLEDGLDDAGQQRDVQEIIKAADRAAVLTRQLLAFSRQQVREPVTLDVNGVLTDVTRLLRRLIGEDIELVTTLGRDPLYIQADAGQVEQVILNLVVNARDAMPQGGRVQVEARRATGEELAQVRMVADGMTADGVALAVRDTGTGMTPDVQARIFEPFFTTKAVGKGTGLGLATVYGIVRQNHGHITVDSEPGRGTTFTVFFPGHVLASAPARQLEGNPVAPAVPATRQHLLLVEDEESVRQLLRLMLERAGYVVHEAASPAAAEALFPSIEEKLRLVISDVLMPGGRGPDLVARLVSRKPSLRVVYISGYLGDTSDGGFLRPEDVYLQKPFPPSKLVEAVRRALA